MNPEIFLKNIDLVSDSSNGIESLRAYILKLAVQGRLTTQIEKEGPAIELLENIEKQKKELIKKGLLKKFKESASINQNEFPYEIPPNWSWRRISEITHDWGQKKPDKTFTYIDVSSINQSKGLISKQTQVLDTGSAPSRARKIVHKDTIIYSTVRPYLLNIAIIDKEFEPEPIASTAFAILHPFDGINNRYLFYYLRSRPFIDYVQKEMKGMAYPAINDEKMSMGLVPVPPCEEQKRIVEKVDQLMTLCDALEAQQEKQIVTRRQLNDAALNALLSSSSPEEFERHWQRIADNFDLFYDDLDSLEKLRQAILQLAVNGKLFQNNSNKKSGALPPGWKLLSLKEVGDWGSGSTPLRTIGEYYGGDVNWFKSGELTEGVIYESEEKITKKALAECSLRMNKPGDVLIAMYGATVGKTSIMGVEGTTNQAVCACTCNGLINNHYLLLLLKAYKDKFISMGAGAAQPNISKIKIISSVVPVPPPEEQKRILEKVNRVMDLFEELETKIVAKFENLEELTKSLLNI